MDRIDDKISQYNITHDTALLINAMTELELNLQDKDPYKQFYLERKLTIARLLHEYDLAQSVLSQYPESDFGVFGKKLQFMITQVSIFNYQELDNERVRALDELIDYMEYCFERQDSIDIGNEAGFLQKYDNNKLAKESIATSIEYESLSWYVMARLLRGDKQQEIHNRLDVLTKGQSIGSITQEMLLNLLTKQIQDIDFDMNL